MNSFCVVAICAAGPPRQLNISEEFVVLASHRKKKRKKRQKHNLEKTAVELRSIFEQLIF